MLAQLCVTRHRHTHIPPILQVSHPTYHMLKVLGPRWKMTGWPTRLIDTPETSPRWGSLRSGQFETAFGLGMTVVGLSFGSGGYKLCSSSFDSSTSSSCKFQRKTEISTGTRSEVRRRHKVESSGKLSNRVAESTTPLNIIIHSVLFTYVC